MLLNLRMTRRKLARLRRRKISSRISWQHMIETSQKRIRKEEEYKRRLAEESRKRERERRESAKRRAKVEEAGAAASKAAAIAAFKEKQSRKGDKKRKEQQDVKRRGDGRSITEKLKKAGVTKSGLSQTLTDKQIIDSLNKSTSQDSTHKSKKSALRNPDHPLTLARDNKRRSPEPSQSISSRQVPVPPTISAVETSQGIPTQLTNKSNRSSVSFAPSVKKPKVDLFSSSQSEKYSKSPDQRDSQQKSFSRDGLAKTTLKRKSSSSGSGHHNAGRDDEYRSSTTSLGEKKGRSEFPRESVSALRNFFDGENDEARKLFAYNFYRAKVSEKEEKR